MQFEDNRARKPFYGFVMIYLYIKRRWQRRQALRELHRLSHEDLKDIGLTRYDLSRWE